MTWLAMFSVTLLMLFHQVQRVKLTLKIFEMRVWLPIGTLFRIVLAL